MKDWVDVVRPHEARACVGRLAAGADGNAQDGDGRTRLRHWLHRLCCGRKAGQMIYSTKEINLM